MKYRQLGTTGFQVSEISFGAWAIGGSWGTKDDAVSLAALHKAVDCGMNFIDTADVYGDGHSERLIAQLKRERADEVIVATKAGRRLSPHVAEGYTKENLAGFVERSLRNLGAEALDLVQLHCPPTAVYYRPEVFGAMDELVAAGKVRNYGVSVEKVEEGIKAIEYPGVKTVQIIFNCFRQRPAELFLGLAKGRQVGILARVPLASGLLTGRLTRQTAFAEDDHRKFNRLGQAFDRGETFSGVDYDVALEAVGSITAALPAGLSLPHAALRWILEHEAVTCAIPGCRTPEQVVANCEASGVGRLPEGLLDVIRETYEGLIRPGVHQRW